MDITETKKNGTLIRLEAEIDWKTMEQTFRDVVATFYPSHAEYVEGMSVVSVGATGDILYPSGVSVVFAKREPLG